MSLDKGFVGSSEFSNLENVGGDPPDGAVAASSSYVVEAVNSSMSVYDRSGSKLSEVGLGAFFGAGAAVTYDPRLLFDSRSNRWLALVVDRDPQAFTSLMHIGLSAGPDPRGAWCRYAFDIQVDYGFRSLLFADYPGLGVDDFGFQVTLDRFSFAGTFRDAKLFSISRSMMIGCPSGVLIDTWTITQGFSDGTPFKTLQPAITFGAAPAQYLVGSEILGGASVAVLRLTGEGTSAVTLQTLAEVPVPYYQAPGPAAQLGSTMLIGGLDSRITGSAVYRDGALWFAHAASAPSGQPGVIWYQVQTATLQVIQRELTWFSTGGYFQPAVTVDASGTMTMVMAASGTDFYPGTVYTVKTLLDPPSLAQRPQFFASSVSPHTRADPRFGRARWGDYHGIAMDPDGVTVWLEGERTVGTSSWGTIVASIRPSSGIPTSKYGLTLGSTVTYAGSAVRVTAQLQTLAGAPLPLAGRTVTWSAAGPGGTFNSPSSTTDATGAATVWFRTAATAGTYTVFGSDDQNATGATASFSTTVRVPTSTTYLPNVTKTLGGPSGWVTPFYVQNVGAVPVELEIAFFRFSDGTFVTQRNIASLVPNGSFSDNPNADADLPDSTQFSVVIKSFGAPIVATVNQVQGVGAATQALSYTGAMAGATRIYLPNVTRRFYGYDVPFILQNLGNQPATAVANFVSFDGSQRFTTALAIAPGRSGVVDPNFTTGLIDGTQYAVSISSDQPLAAVVNAHSEQGAPVAFSHNGLSGGANTVYAPYVANQDPAIGRFSPVVVQNLGSAPVDATLRFTPLGSAGPVQTLVLSGIAPGAARPFDPRFTVGTSTLCTGASATCLGRGEFSLAITALGPIAAVVLPVSATTAAAYTAASTVGTKSYLPIVARNAGLPTGMTGFIALQSVTASAVSLRFYSTANAALVLTQAVTLPISGAIWIDPRTLPGLVDGTYSVTIDGSGGTLAAVVYELGPVGDGAMAYEGFASP